MRRLGLAIIFWVFLLPLALATDYSVMVSRDASNYYVDKGSYQGVIRTTGCFEFAFFDAATLQLDTATTGTLLFSSGARCAVVNVYDPGSVQLGTYNLSVNSNGDGYYELTNGANLIKAIGFQLALAASATVVVTSSSQGFATGTLTLAGSSPVFITNIYVRRVAATTTLTTPILTSPADNATITGNSVTLTWSGAFGANAYSVRVINLATGQVYTFPLATTTTYGITNLAPGVTYGWTVASCLNSSVDTVVNCPSVSTRRTFTSRAVVSLAGKGGIDSLGNGKGEIVVRSASAQSQIGRLTVNNVIQFTPANDPGSAYRIVGIGDFDGNGKSDLAFQNITQGTFGDVKIRKDFSSSNEVFWRQVKQVWDVQAVGDLDGDGFGDMVWRYVVPNSPDTGVSYIWFSNGNSITQIRKRGGAPLDWQLLGAMDLNGDGAVDMVYLSPQNQLRVLMATPNRTCANLTAGNLPTGFTALKFADMTGNGRGDILIRNSSGTTQLLSLNANGLVLPTYSGAPDDQNASCTSSALTIPVTTISLPTTDPTWQFYAAADLNGDGITDIVWLQPSGNLVAWIMNPNGMTPTVLTNAGTAPVGYSVFQNGGPLISKVTPTQKSAEGIYTGTTSNGFSFYSAVLENDQFWTIYGLPNVSGGLTIYGIVEGDGSSNNGSYISSNAKAFDYLGNVSANVLAATYVPNVSFNGTFGSTIISGAPPIPSSYIYNTPAVLSDISGPWSGSLLDNSFVSLSISANGILSGSTNGCAFSGTILPRASGKNVFNVSLTFGASPCLLAGQTTSGIALDYLVAGGIRQLLIGGVDITRSVGTAFVGNR